ncbi:MAG: ROK family protein [Halanaerobiales bacterium]|nr:ROK family protein [Halanaerobiales bacterium]MCF8009538.1 ROK family protein [Halanaerobiales bacterium]
MKKKYYIGVDIGGTKILTALTDKKGNILSKAKKPTEADLGQEVIMRNIQESIDKVVDKSEVQKESIIRIGVGSPGPLDYEKGIIIENSNLSWKNVPIVKILNEINGIDVVLENDANAAALAENYFGAGKKADCIVYITISTGIGGGIIINRRIFHGGKGNAGEIGHMTLVPESVYQCGCGNKGCFEAVASGTAIARRAKDAVLDNKDNLIYKLCKGDLDKIDALLVAEAAKKGDYLALEIFKITGNLLGVGIANVVNLFDPEIIVLGGGVMSAESLFIDQMVESLKERALKPNLENLVIKKAELGKNTGVLGAVAVAMGDDLL